MYDVLVIGAGPTGCVAAETLADNGLHVLLTDKMPFPREKSCSGILIKKSMELIEKYMGTPIPQSVQCRPANNKGIVFFDEAGKEHRFEQSGLNIWRSSFDHWLIQKAKNAGTELRLSTYASLVEEMDGYASVRLHGDTVYTEHAKAVLVCTGAADTLKRKLFGASTEKIITYQAFYRGSIDLDPHYFYAFLQPEFSQYDAWFNVKDDFLVAGVACKDVHSIARFHKAFLSFLEQRHRASFEEKIKSEQWTMPHIQPDCPLTQGKGHILFAGEAAGFLNPMGEGISCGMESGFTAAQTVLQSYRGDYVDVPLMQEAYRTNLEPIESYMQRQWQFVARISSSFAHMA